ncbi:MULTISPECIES: beta-N-acetylhexosaminidase [Acidobacteriaceae]|uniref:beta-N-acetylhexosaminidase n=1 Tax=Acidobacteriaceae TaxID=204434 RepID=UPI00131DABAC|nr:MULTISPECIES: beta-N-acetylhexosaminidase [Acidobacteriaceae]MDW5266940.1 beta-N-acetylhexosaminidase [Edaphobacter sp.]
MSILTRREFIQAAGGATMSRAIVPHVPFGTRAAIAPAMNFSRNDNTANTPIQFLIFPEPREISASQNNFVLDSQARVVIPSNASDEDLFLASSLVNEIGDQFGLYLKIERVENLNGQQRTILMGSISNPLVQQCCSHLSPSANIDTLGPEGYILRSEENTILVAGSDERGAFYGMQSLRQLLISQDNRLSFKGVHIRDWPDKPFRGIYLFLPGRDNIAFFKRFVRDYMALYKFNTLIMEMGASMRLDKHPELNYGWVQFARDANYSCRNYPPRPFHDIEQNSSHQDTADGGFLEKEEVADLVRWIEKHHIELIPEIASFTHSYYLLTRQKELAAIPENKWPDIYCPTNPKAYSLVFEVYDEYIDLLKPKSIHIGHDELFLPVGASPHCADVDIGELFGEDVRKIHDYLASKGIKTQLWGDMLLESVRGVGLKKQVAPDGWIYQTPGGMTPEQVGRLIPKDCLIFNWFWSKGEGTESNAELNEATLDKMGFQQVFGNFTPDIENYESRKKRTTLLGAATSSWSATNEFNFGKDLMINFLGSSSILWSGQVMQTEKLVDRIQSMLPGIRGRLSGIVVPSLTEKLIIPIDISEKFNTSETLASLGTDLAGLKTGLVYLQKIPFDLKSVNGKCAIAVGVEGRGNSGLADAVTGIRVGEAATSLIFLHAAAKPASNKESFRLIWDQEDTADLLGWYEIVYEDGFITSIPIRYGVNILEWDWGRRPTAHNYCYGADALSVGSHPDSNISFFAFEWINPRLGKVIEEVRLKGTKDFRGGSNDFNNSYGPVIESNAVILKAVSVVRKRT